MTHRADDVDEDGFGPPSGREGRASPEGPQDVGHPAKGGARERDQGAADPGRLDGSLFGEDQPCFGCAPVHPIGFRLAFERTGEGVRTTFVPSEQYQGPPGVMHGGLVMTLADEIGAWAVIAESGKFGFTASIDGRLVRPIRIGREVVGCGRVLRSTRRVVTTEVSIEQGGEVAFEGQLRFALLDQAGAERLLGGPIPESWRRFSR